jgi:peptidyl-prolyl cis-trans isomerase C
MLGILLVLVFQLPFRISAPLQEAEIWSNKDQLDYANTLLAKGLQSEAASALEKYIENVAADKVELARACYRLGSIYMDLYQYEKALALFYRAEMLDKEADFTQEMNPKIVAALENLGLSSQARYELAKRTSLRDTANQEGKVLARIGTREITQAEIDRALGNLPEWMRKQFEDKDQRLKFIQDYVASEVLYEKAKRLGLDKSPQIRQALENTRKQMALQSLLAKEVEKKLKIDAQDMQNYYRANKDKYTEPEKIKVRFVEFSGASEKDEALKLLNEGKGKTVEGWIERGSTYIPDIGQAKDAIEELFLKEKGEYSNPLKIKEKFYIFSIEDKQPQRVKSFAEVKSQVEYEYRSNKERQITEALLRDAFEEQEVEIFYKPGDDESKESN